jgi:NAD(P)-dependent dehydrogenase (short-subunit alcohol dehydrogenase family)
MTEDFSGKVVIVAGGTGGLGRAVCLAFLDAGARVAVPFHRAEEFAALEQTAGARAGSGDAARLKGMAADVTDPHAARGVMETVLETWGRLDAVVNTVGGYAGGVPLWETTAETFERMVDLNLRTGYALARGAVPAMLERKSGVLVNVAARAAVDHAAGASAYAATKAAAVALMDSLAADLKGTGVRVNSILPSIIDTEANRRAMPKADFAKWPKPEAIARVILFLCSEDAAVVHGAAIPVYGTE